jgi:hypothetical protein
MVHRARSARVSRRTVGFTGTSLIGVLALASALAGCGGAAPHQVSAASSRQQTAAESTQAHPRFFAPTSLWNAPLPADVPTARDSAALIASLLAMVHEEVAAKVGPWISTTGYSTPIYTVPASQPLVPVRLDANEPHLQQAFSAVPLPADAQPASGRDSQLTVWQPSTDRMWEFWHLSHQQDGWQARWGGAMDRVSENPGVFTAQAWPGANPYWGATATSLPLVGGLITLEDLQRQIIDHALALGLPRVARGVVLPPAQRTDGTADGSGAIPAGTRFRLDPNLDLQSLSLPPLTLMIAQAAQRYGIIVRDTSSIVDFYGEDPTPTGTDPYRALFADEYIWQQLAKFPWERLEVIAPNTP